MANDARNVNVWLIKLGISSVFATIISPRPSTWYDKYRMLTVDCTSMVTSPLIFGLREKSKNVSVFVSKEKNWNEVAFLEFYFDVFIIACK